jgi:hypothetical protein
MAERPIYIKDKTNVAVKIRDEEPAKFLGPPSFKFTSVKTQKQRIQVEFFE